MQLASGDTTHFPTHYRVSRLLEPHSRLISSLIDAFERRISGMNSFLPLIKIFTTPVAINATTAPDNFQLELLDFQEDVELKGIFRSEDLLYFWSPVS